MTLFRTCRAALLMLCLGATAYPCAAQSPAFPNAPAPRSTDACSQDRRSSSGQTLSDKLEQTDGVICPPDIDPDIKAAPPPQGGRMPVIPPPGSPGGDPTVRPK